MAAENACCLAGGILRILVAIPHADAKVVVYLYHLVDVLEVEEHHSAFHQSHTPSVKLLLNNDVDRFAARVYLPDKLLHIAKHRLQILVRAIQIPRDRSAISIFSEILAQAAKHLLVELLVLQLIDFELVSPAQGLDEHVLCCRRVQITSSEEFHENDRGAGVIGGRWLNERDAPQGCAGRLRLAISFDEYIW